jgi:hypothetical protein
MLQVVAHFESVGMAFALFMLSVRQTSPARALKESSCAFAGVVLRSR